MEKMQVKILSFLMVFGLGFYSHSFLFKESTKSNSTVPANPVQLQEENLKLGAFSISLSVKDLESSRVFYEKLGFEQLGGETSKDYLIMKNENCLIGLFQGMFEGNILTFNPGWDENAQNIDEFHDVREIQKHLKSENLDLTSEADENTSGPASLMLYDPDGNLILIDQHR